MPDNNDMIVKTELLMIGKVLKRLHYPIDVMLTCVRWYVAYPLSLRHIDPRARPVARRADTDRRQD